MTTRRNTAEQARMEELRQKFSAIIAPPVARSMSRKAWSIDLNTVWVPWFTAHKTIGSAGTEDISNAALGAPIVLARDKSGTPRVTATGKLTYKVNPELNAAVRRQMANYVAALQEETKAIVEEAPKAYAAQVVRQQEAGDTIIKLDAATVEAFEAALAEAQAEPEAAAESETVPAPEPEPAMVG